MAAVQPMLATLGSAADIDESDGDWAFEMKWDGIRLIATISGGRVRLATRNGNDVTATYPELATLTELVDGDAVLDGEIVAPDRHGRPDFGRLQQRSGLTKRSEVEAAARRVAVRYLVFDVLSHDEEDATGLDYDERRALLRRILTDGDVVVMPPAFEGDLAAAFASSKELGLEGVMAKRRDSTYASGRRSRAWIKIKHHLSQEVIVGGWRPGAGRRGGGIGSLLLGIPGEKGLHYVGRVGTGFGDRALEEIAHRLQPLGRKTTPFEDIPRADAVDAHWVRPSLVAEVEFAEWTTGDRLRQPSWKGWRDDKAPDEVRKETPGR